MEKDLENGNAFVNDSSSFPEKEEILRCLKALSAKSFNISRMDVLNTILMILERYQEKPTLLDTSLQECISPLLVRVKEILQEHEDLYTLQKKESALFAIQRYENGHFHMIMTVLFAFMKVRGYKTIMKFLPHEVVDLEPVVRLYLSLDQDAPQLWKSRYVLFVWLSILVIIPFDLVNVDSTLKTSDEEGALVPTIIKMCKSALLKHEATNVPAAICLGKLLTRPDLEEIHLIDFIDWCNVTLTKILSTETINTASQVIGILQALTSIFQFGYRATLVKVTAPALHLIQLIGQNVTGDFQLRNKLIMKFSQRIGMSFLPPRVPTWIYNRGKRGIQTKKLSEPHLDAVASTSGADKQDQNSIESYDIPEELDGVVDTLLRGLTDADTNVRWSSAKGIGRITSRLPTLELADQILEGVIEVFSDSDNESGWHGGCLALAELTRRGLLLPQRLEVIVPIVIKALTYDLRRGSHSVGSNVRDAASYVCWAFARAYTPDVLKNYQSDIAKSLMVTALFDREINCRRAASAAFQENVGRQGINNFPHGIELLTKTDFYAVGNRNNSFLVIGPYVASFPEYTQVLIDHVVNIKIEHWDDEIRVLSAQALHNLTPCDPEYVIAVVIPRLIQNILSNQVFRRHGALLALSEIILSLSHINYSLSEDTLKSIRNVIPNLEKEKLYRGKGGSLIRVGVCRLIEAISLAHHPLSEKAILRLLESLNDHFKQGLEEIPLAASFAFRSFSKEYFKQLDASAMDKVISFYIIALDGRENTCVTRGFTLAIGCLPAYTVSTVERQKVVFTSLINASHIQDKREERDAETRKNAIKAMSDLAIHIGVGENGLNQELIQLIFDSLLNGTMDYCIEDRGDIGSWVRKESLFGIEQFLDMLLTAELTPPELYSAADAKIDFKEGTLIQTQYGSGKFLGKEDNNMLLVEFDDTSSGAREFPFKKAILSPTECKIELGETEYRCGDSFSRLDYLTPNINEKIITAIQSASPVFESHFKETHHYYAERMIPQFINVLIKQSVEKIDNVRQCAGEILSRVLYHNPPFSYIPEKVDLLKIIPESFNSWCSPQFLFPMMIKILGLEDYRDSFIEGIIVSAGGLTLSLSKPSSETLIHWCQTQSGLGVVALAHMAFYLIHVFELYKGNTRVIYPLLQMCDQLISNDCFKKLSEQEREKFYLELVRVTVDEVKKTRDAKKILYSIPILIGMVGMAPNIREAALKHLFVNLTHPFPKVRTVTGEQLYIKLLTIDDILSEEEMDKVSDILSVTNWNDEDVEVLKVIKLPLYEIFHLPLPQYQSKGTTTKTKKDDQLDEAGFQEMLDLGR